PERLYSHFYLCNSKHTVLHCCTLMRFNFRMEVLDVACEVKLCVHPIGVSNRIAKLHEFWILVWLHSGSFFKQITLPLLSLALSVLDIRLRHRRMMIV